MKTTLITARHRFSMSFLLAGLLNIATESQAHDCSNPGSVINILIQNGANYASQGTYAIPFKAPPLTWLNFSANAINEKEVKLEWQIAERHNPGFLIQHSEDGKNWRDLTLVKTDTMDAGGRPYSFNHKHPAIGSNYYRIRTQSDAGKVSYTVVRMVLIRTADAPISIWPNPAIETLNLDGDNRVVRKAIISDITGRPQMEKLLQPGDKSLFIRSLRPGIYSLTVYATDGRTQKVSFLKQ